MKLFYSTLLLLLASITTQAQYTDIINSNRPGASVGAYSVGKNVFQIESSLGFKTTSFDYNEIALNFNSEDKQQLGSLFLRYGFLSERLEINLILGYLKSSVNQVGEDILTGPFDTTTETKGFNINTIGLKYMIFQPKTEREVNIRSWKANQRINWKEFIPTISISAEMHTDMVSAPFKTNELAFKGGLLLQNNFSSGLVFTGNVFVDQISDPNKRYFNYIAGLTYAFNKKFSMFAEYDGKRYKTQAKEHWGGFGLAYLLNKDMQIDLDARKLFGSKPYGFTKNHQSYYIGLGLSWRADMHKDSYKIKTSDVKENSDAGGGDRKTRKAAKKAARKNKKATKRANKKG
jgi:hypothetical protein